MSLPSSSTPPPPTGFLESVELPVFNHEAEAGTCCNGGDPGSLVDDIYGRLVLLLHGGTDGSDITYSTPFAYVWELVCEEFPGANLYFDDLAAFFADVPA